MQDYKHGITEYDDFYKNGSEIRLFHNPEKEAQKQKPQDEDFQRISEYLDKLIETISSKNDEAVNFIKLLNEEFKNPKFDIDDLIKDKDIIPFLFHILAQEPQPRSIQSKCMKLLYNIIDSYEPLHQLIIDTGFVEFLVHTIFNVQNNVEYLSSEHLSIPDLLFAENDIFNTVFHALNSLKYLYDTSFKTNEQVFMEALSFKDMRDAYLFIAKSLHKEFPKEFLDYKELKTGYKNRIKVHILILKGLTILLSKISSFFLSFEDMQYVYEIIHFNLLSLDRELPEKDSIEQFSLSILKNLIENKSINEEFYDDFNDSDIFQLLIEQIQTSSSQNKIIRSCDILVSLFENHYFDKYPFIYTVNEILDFIDYANENNELLSPAYLKLLSAMIRNDNGEEGGFVHQCLFSESENEKGFRTICLNTSRENNFDHVISASHCFLDLYEKTPPDFRKEYLEDYSFNALHSIIETGFDSDRPDILSRGLEILLDILKTSQALSPDEYSRAISMVIQADLPNLLVEDLSECEDETITALVDQINELINAEIS